MKKNCPSPSAFTLVEVLVSVTVLALMMSIVAEMMTSTQNTITRANAHVREFQESRRVLDAMTDTLSQASMDAVWGYRRSPTDATLITGYDRVSDHHFISGSAFDLLPDEISAEAGQAVFFQAPLGNVRNIDKRRLHDLVNCCGYYIQYGTDFNERPKFMTTHEGGVLNPERKRFRLMQYLQPAEDSLLYADGTRLGLNQQTVKAKALQWYQKDIRASSVALADNILALVLTPYAIAKREDGSSAVSADVNYSYDSRDFQWNGLNAVNENRRHRLPAKVGVTLISADERSYETLVSKLGEENAAAAVRSVLNDKFSDHRRLKEDLANVEKELSALPLHHKVMTSMVVLRSSN